MKRNDISWYVLIALSLGIYVTYIIHCAHLCESRGGNYVRPWSGGWYKCIGEQK
jgi:hypothetical protein